MIGSFIRFLIVRLQQPILKAKSKSIPNLKRLVIAAYMELLEEFFWSCFAIRDTLLSTLPEFNSTNLGQNCRMPPHDQNCPIKCEGSRITVVKSQTARHKKCCISATSLFPYGHEIKQRTLFLILQSIMQQGTLGLVLCAPYVQIKFSFNFSYK